VLNYFCRIYLLVSIIGVSTCIYSPYYFQKTLHWIQNNIFTNFHSQQSQTQTQSQTQSQTQPQASSKQNIQAEKDNAKYFLILGTFHSKNSAIHFSNKIDSVYSKQIVKNKNLYEVQVGPYKKDDFLYSEVKHLSKLYFIDPKIVEAK